MSIFNRTKGSYRIGLIGFGAIGKTVASAISHGEAGNCQLLAVLRETDSPGNAEYLVTNNPEVFFDWQFDLVIEAAGHLAVRQYAKRVLSQETDLLLTSMGALSDEVLQESLIQSADSNKVRLLLASGALPAVDWMSAACVDPGAVVSITQEKPVSSWRGTPAEELIELDTLSSAQCFFEGSAREAAGRFPRSSNITAMLALATVGLDEASVKLVADPCADKMRTLVSMHSRLGELQLTWHGLPSRDNPRTSVDVAHTVIKAVRNLTSPMIIGV